jgi:hypothetical protein
VVVLKPVAFSSIHEMLETALGLCADPSALTSAVVSILC